MKKLTVLLAGLGMAAAALPGVANAAPWNINQRQANIEQRINQGIRHGDVTRREAMQLRNQLRSIATLEQRYRRSGGGLDMRERRDLDRRLDVLSRRVQFERHDRQERHGYRR